MIIPYKFVVIYPLLTLQPCDKSEQNNLIPYRAYTTTSLMTNHDIKAYERFWSNIIKEDYDSNSMTK